MIDIVWNAERFGSELTALLVSVLAGEGLSLAVTECAAAAEAVCCDRPMACGAGCPHCCVLNVAVLLPEGMAIADWLRERLHPSELDDLCVRLTDYCRRVRWMEDDERITNRVDYPMLDAKDNCSIHPVRPLVCRAVASLDSASCREIFNPVVTDEERLVNADMLRQAVYDEAFMALALALALAIRHHGLDDRSIELGRGVLAFLVHPGLREQLLSGERLPADLWQW